ncbi:hypothetical protein [Pseudomonas protegens]
MFGVATGWLGWPPDTAWRTPIPQIMLALDARIDWMNQGKAQQKPVPQKPSSVADRLKAFFRGREE